jgi:glycosyltransferase involved in cell wall biosynthesis
MDISVVIPTCNRKAQTLLLLKNLNQSSLPLYEVLIIDSGEDKLSQTDYRVFTNLNIHYVESEKSVCIQRNVGIRKARSEWIFLCDDDMEVPTDYLQKLAEHSAGHPEAGAISGLVLQKLNNEWRSSYPINSAVMLIWKFIFQLNIWGEINCRSNNIVVRKIKRYYQRKGNHISKAGWPVVTNFSGDYFTTPVYGLGASLVRRDWLLRSPYEEVLDKHGIGDNYGVNMGFPSTGIHVLTAAFVYHHRGPENRLLRPLQYFRRVLALDYFRKVNKKPAYVKKYWLLWSLAGNFLSFLFDREIIMLRPAVKLIWRISLGRNPYYHAAKLNKKVVEPML